MKVLSAGGMFSICAVLGGVIMDDRINQQPDARLVENLRDVLPKYENDFVEIGMSASAASLRKLVAEAGSPDCTWGKLQSLADEMHGRIVDEANARQFFSLSVREADWYSLPRRGWERPLERFPDIVDDVEEASKCFALSRYAGAVFHSVQIIEVGLIDLGTFLKVTDPRSGWTAVSGALETVIRKNHKARTRFEQKNFAFLEQMQGLVHGLKNAWRNKISHAHGRLILMSKEFSPEVAEEILVASRAFMRRLADDLPPPKPKKASRAKKKQS